MLAYYRNSKQTDVEKCSTNQESFTSAETQSGTLASTRPASDGNSIAYIVPSAKHSNYVDIVSVNGIIS